ncbi:MAG: hypothetical protein Q4B85_04130 [Lachnospiraceae bacterium]|nr:hypothetical protein [Lachnospiraceae bacterium]
MENYRKKAVSVAFLLLALSLSGCGKNGAATEPAAESSSAESVVSASSEVTPPSVHEDITTTSNYYEEPAPEAGTGDAEGFIPTDLPEGTLIESTTGLELTFTEQEATAYAVTIDKAEYTDRRSVLPDDQAEKVLLVTYSYRSLNQEARFVDEMSFRLFAGETPIEPYYVADQITGDVSTDSAVTAEVCYSVPADAEDFVLFVLDNAQENNEIYSIALHP